MNKEVAEKILVLLGRTNLQWNEMDECYIIKQALVSIIQKEEKKQKKEWEK